MYGFNYKVPPKEEFSAVEKRHASEVFSILLLRMRDKKSRGFRKKGVLLQLYREIEEAAAELVGDYSDSDDEDEDEEVEAMSEGVKGPAIQSKKAFELSVEPDSDDEEVVRPSISDRARGKRGSAMKGDAEGSAVRESMARRRQSNNADINAKGRSKMEVFR